MRHRLLKIMKEWGLAVVLFAALYIGGRLIGSSPLAILIDAFGVIGITVLIMSAFVYVYYRWRTRNPEETAKLDAEIEARDKERMR